MIREDLLTHSVTMYRWPNIRQSRGNATLAESIGMGFF